MIVEVDLKPVPFLSPLDRYEEQAAQLLAGHRAGDAEAIRVFHQRHPRFLDDKVVWLPKRIPDSEIQGAALDVADAQLTIARWYNFRDWAALAGYVSEVSHDGAVRRFESAVEAVIAGDLGTLEFLLRDDPELVRERSTRITDFDPPVHRATLLHYIAANGVEGYRQKTPPNAVEIARAVLRGGAEPDALANMYGGECTTMAMLVSSSPPAEAGLQVALAETLIDFGAAVEACGSGRWTSPLMTALDFGFLKTAEALVRRGARVDSVAAAAGLGRLDEATRLLPAADAESRHRAMTLASQLGHVEIVRLLLDAGEDANRFNAVHCHSTPLHSAALAGHEAVVRLLVERGAKLDTKDTLYQGTPLAWAMYAGKSGIADYLRAHGAEEK